MISQTERNNPPFAASMGDFTFPKFSVHKLSGGTKVFLVRNNRQPLVSVRIMAECGPSISDIPGLAVFAMKMLTNGTKKMSAMKIAETAEYLGAKLHSTAKWDFSLISSSSLSNYLDECLDLMEDCLFNPKFSTTEIERQKRKTLANIQQNLADPSYLSKLAFNSLMHIDNLYGISITGTTESISQIYQEDLLKWHSGFLDSTSFNIIVSGLFEKEEILQKLESRFGAIKSAKSQKPTDFTNGHKNGTKIVVFDKQGGSQVSLRFGRTTLSPRHPDYPAMQTANVIFGGYFLSRINELLREKLGYTYGISSTIDSRKNSSVFVTSSSLKKDSVKDSIEKLYEEMDRLSKDPVGEDELFRASQYILGSFLRSVESPQQTASLILGMINYSLPYDYYNYMYQRIKSLSSEELFEVQKEYFKPEGLVIAVAGDKKELVSSLSSIGSMYECDKDGKISII